MNSQGHQSRTASFDGEGVSTPPLLDETEIVEYVPCPMSKHKLTFEMIFLASLSALV